MPRKIDHLERVQIAADELQRAHKARDKAIIAASKSGESLRAIAERAGLSAAGVLKIVRRG
jgi:lambda repressor-like predicted transcriptional regulator